MQELVNEVVDYLYYNIYIIGPLLSVLFIMLESFIAIIPVSAFITLNFLYYGDLLGFSISWLATIMGSILSFLVFRKLFSDKLYRWCAKSKKIEKVMNFITDVGMMKLIIIFSIPFTPGFLVNISCGLSKMNFKKFVIAVIIGKILLVYFWGYIGSNLLLNITNISVIIKLVVIIIFVYIISKIVNKKISIE